MIFDKTEEARLAMGKGALVSYRAGGRKYIVNLIRERKDGKFYFHGTKEGGVEKITGWDDPHRFAVIE